MRRFYLSLQLTSKLTSMVHIAISNQNETLCSLIVLQVFFRRCRANMGE
jgi:hypothetical protein